MQPADALGRGSWAKGALHLRAHNRSCGRGQRHGFLGDFIRWSSAASRRHNARSRRIGEGRRPPRQGCRLPPPCWSLPQSEPAKPGRRLSRLRRLFLVRPEPMPRRRGSAAESRHVPKWRWHVPAPASPEPAAETRAPAPRSQDPSARRPQRIKRAETSSRPFNDTGGRALGRARCVATAASRSQHAQQRKCQRGAAPSRAVLPTSAAASPAFALATTYDGAPGAPGSGPAVRPNVELALRGGTSGPQELGVEDAQKRLRTKGSSPAAERRLDRAPYFTPALDAAVPVALLLGGVAIGRQQLAASRDATPSSTSWIRFPSTRKSSPFACSARA